ncbi:hypothetical protein OO015_00620 [Thermomicrobium sp. 4228-Ro]|uniref:hypothetical protein n=1 Tax=Thermomicrobium sp. 4228-Ro TaxID=2993937 RepID=UPI002248A2B9|nr:hypothetical protein [Thermomicrobium sp. 4228-Ro]MCX2726011.1 hypothetical protein [Thermomicrobium sp. 4228-Ro]
MPRFRKRPIVVEATRITEPMAIATPEGVMQARAGDWIITGIAGERYPCRHDIFVATYEPVDEEAVRALAADDPGTRRADDRENDSSRRLSGVALQICEDLEDECWGIRREVLDGVLDGDEALREIWRLLRSQMALVLDLLREAEQDAEGSV